MKKGTRPVMSDAEQQVLKVLWDHGAGTVREVLERLAEAGSDWTRSTVITLLQRLEKKGYVASDKRQFAFVFRPIVTRETEIAARMQEIAGELCDGETLPLVLAFAQKHRFSPEEIATFRDLIDGLEAKSTWRRKP